MRETTAACHEVLWKTAVLKIKFMTMGGSFCCRIGKMDMDVSEKAPDPGPVTTFNFTMELDQEQAIEKFKILDPDMELLNWHIRLNHSLVRKSR